MAAAVVAGSTVYAATIATSAVGDNLVPLSVSSEHSQGPRSLHIENNTANPIYIAYDKAASLGSHLLPSGYIFNDDACNCVNLHIYTGVASAINGTAVGGIVVWGSI